MKINRNLKWGILILLIGIFCTLYGAFNNGIKSIAFDGIKPIVLAKEQQDVKTIKNQKFNTINIDVKRTKIKISQSDHYEIIYHGKKSDLPTIKIENHQLMISQTNNVLTQIEHTIHWKEVKRLNRNNSMLEIKVPKNVKLQEIQIFNNYGITNIFGIDTESLAVAELNGQIVLNGIKTKAIDLEANLGNGIYLNNSQIANGQIQNTQTPVNASQGNIINVAFDASGSDLNFDEGTINGGVINAKDGDVNLNQVRIENNVAVNNSHGNNNNVNQVKTTGYKLSVQNGQNQLFDQHQKADAQTQVLSKIQSSGNVLSLTTTNGNNVIK